jgi:ubiquinone/menaquinone biosynthesis C-methylase UbiE
VRILRETLPLPAQCGVDLCCGTANYTRPFINDFSQIFGLDLSPEMLNEARKRVDGVKWIRADAKDSGLPPSSCDAAWMISALHYFQGDEHPCCLAKSIAS